MCQGRCPALKALDGRGPSTLLTSLLTEELNIESIESIIDWVYSRNIRPGDIASLSKLVGYASSNGDEVSQGILGGAGRELAFTASAVIKRLSLSGEFPLALCGGSLVPFLLLLLRMRLEKFHRIV